VTAKRDPANPMLAAALRYAQADWPVFPCAQGQKVPATRHGYLDATTDPDKITWWWSRNPDRNVAIATGRPGPDVLDVDIHPGGNGFAAFTSSAVQDSSTGPAHMSARPAAVCTPTSPAPSRATGGCPLTTWTSVPAVATSSPRHPASAAGLTNCSNIGRARLGWTGWR
jgi:Bifunctional DNA primase/polymerase, N-terminal